MNKFGKGFISGITAAFAVVGGVLFSFKKKVVEPLESQDQKADENRKKIQRKAGSTHLG